MNFTILERNDFSPVHLEGVVVHNSDFQSNAKESMKDFFVERYGKENICSVGTIGYLRVKSTLKELGRAYEIDDQEINELTTVGLKELEKDDDGLPLNELCDKYPALKTFLDKYPHVASVFSKLQGAISHWGIHAGGILISDRPLIDQLPLRVDKKTGKLVSCWSEGLNGRELGEMGFLKLDLLAIETLDVIEDAINLINERHENANVNFDDIMEIMMDDKDKKALGRIEENENQGVFQFETPLALRVVRDMGGIRTFDDIAMLSTLMRPAALQNNYGAIFGKRRDGIDPITIPECVRKYMENEYGVPAFQESVYFFSMYMAGMDRVNSYSLMKKMYKNKLKTSEDIELWKNKFLTGCLPKIKHQEYDIEFENGEKRHYTEYDKLKCTDGIEHTVMEIVEKGLEIEKIS